jgi:hypothetical protein
MMMVMIGIAQIASLSTEAGKDVCVESRRGLSPAQVLADYASVSARALEVLATFDGRDTPVALGDFGTYGRPHLHSRDRRGPRPGHAGAPEFLRSVTLRATWNGAGVTFTGDAAQPRGGPADQGVLTRLARVAGGV